MTDSPANWKENDTCRAAVCYFAHQHAKFDEKGKPTSRKHWQKVSADLRDQLGLSIHKKSLKRLQVGSFARLCDEVLFGPQKDIWTWYKEDSYKDFDVKAAREVLQQEYPFLTVRACSKAFTHTCLKGFLAHGHGG